MKSFLWGGIVLLISTTQVFGCDEYSWEEVNREFNNCLNESLYLLEHNGIECHAYESLLECGDVLHMCSDNYLPDVEEILAETFPDIDEIKDALPDCSKLHNIQKRSPKKRGGSSSSSRSTSSRISSAANRGRKVVSGLLNRGRKSGSTGSISGSKPKSKSKLKKFGKYAVAGLAAYGTYKLAKKMSKGLKKAYDDDDCWEYNIFQDRYECECDDECRIYVGSATSMFLSSTLLTLSCLTSFFLLRH